MFAQKCRCSELLFFAFSRHILLYFWRLLNPQNNLFEILFTIQDFPQILIVFEFRQKQFGNLIRLSSSLYSSLFLCLIDYFHFLLNKHRTYFFPEMLHPWIYTICHQRRIWIEQFYLRGWRQFLHNFILIFLLECKHRFLILHL